MVFGITDGRTHKCQLCKHRRERKYTKWQMVTMVCLFSISQAHFTFDNSPSFHLWVYCVSFLSGYFTRVDAFVLNIRERLLLFSSRHLSLSFCYFQSSPILDKSPQYDNIEFPIDEKASEGFKRNGEKERRSPNKVGKHGDRIKLKQAQTHVFLIRLRQTQECCWFSFACVSIWWEK